MTPVKVDEEPEQTIDPNILVLEIYRCPLEKKVWEDYRNNYQNYMTRTRRWIILLRIMIPFSIIMALLINYLIYFSWFLDFIPLFFLTTVQIIYSLFPLAFLFYAILFTKRYRSSQKVFQKIGTSPEEASWWLMDHAKISVYAQYNYLFLKVHWALKQIRAEAITVKSDSVEGIVVSKSDYRIMKATIKPEPGEKNAFTISVMIPDVVALYGQFTKGEFINRFLDLMVSGLLDLKNQQLPLP